MVPCNLEVSVELLQSVHGIYTVKLPFNGQEAQLSGVCLNQITTAFSEYPIKRKIEDDIHEAYNQSGGKPELLPKQRGWRDRFHGWYQISEISTRKGISITISSHHLQISV